MLNKKSIDDINVKGRRAVSYTHLSYKEKLSYIKIK